MTDLMDRLSRLAGQEHIPTEETVRGDLIRGHRASRRRSLQQGAVALGLIAMVGAGGAVAVNVDPLGIRDPATIAVPTSETGGLSIRLVAYTQEQPPGFLIEKVPEGFMLEGANPIALTIARPDDFTGVEVFVDKLVVMLESSSVTGDLGGTPVKVGGHDGLLRYTEEGYQVLTYGDGNHRVYVQSASSIGLSDAQLIEFAEGVTVTRDAVSIIS